MAHPHFMTAWALFNCSWLQGGGRIDSVEQHLSLGCTDLLLSWRMIGLAAMLTHAGLDVGESIHCGTNFVADHCSVSHNKHVAPAGLASQLHMHA